MKLSLKTASVNAYLETSRALREMLGHLIPSGRFLFIAFLWTKIQMGQIKNRSNRKSHNKNH